MNRTPEVLAAEGLSFRYGRRPALEEVTLQVLEGATGLLGPNGAGKTTLIRLFLGLLRPHRGRIRLFGRPLKRLGPKGRSRLGYLPENSAVLPGMSGVEMTAYLARLSGLPAREAMARAHEALDYVGLEEERYRPAASYSAGMRQRLMLAQALAHGPRLVILDEPTNGLDPHGREQMLQLIRELWTQKGLSVLLSSHLLRDVESTCRSVIVLDAGRVVATRELADPAAEAESDERLEVQVRGDGEGFTRALRALGAEVEARGGGVLLLRLPPGEDSRLLFREARRGGLQIRRLLPARATLEEIFTEALGPRADPS